ncbi:hypothetical protein SH611_12540 [Geminicoccaceae bacterium 1502E]|nr:hypothetical protein [Geminicoccaceae bacterium 1502E]
MIAGYLNSGSKAVKNIQRGNNPATDSQKKTLSLPLMDLKANEKIHTIQLLKNILAEGQRQTAVLEEPTRILQGIAATLLERR